MHGEKNIIFNNVSSPIENRFSGVGEPWAVSRHSMPLNKRQQALLDKLPDYDDRVAVKKCDVSMKDLAALTAKTGVEFAMFTVGPKRLVVRGDEHCVNVSEEDASIMNALGYKWSGHTHPGHGAFELLNSADDQKILRMFDQEASVIYNSEGKYRRFFKN